MPTELEELVEFLHHGNTQIRQIAAENLVPYAQAQPSLFKRNQLEPIKDLKLLVKDYDPIKQNALTMLINLSGDKEVLKNLAEDNAFLESLLSRITNQKEPHADEIAMLLANLSKSDSLKRLIKLERPVVADLGGSAGAMDQLMDVFVRGARRSWNARADFDHLAYLLADLSKHADGTAYLMAGRAYDGGVRPLQKLLPFTAVDMPRERRLGAASVLKNVSFTLDAHPELLADDLNLLAYVLLPLASGRDAYSDEEQEHMLVDLQLLDEDVKRDDDVQVLKTHLETLLILSTNRPGREKLRKAGTYYVVRECHSAVDDEDVKEVCDRIVQLLQRDEAAEGGEPSQKLLGQAEHDNDDDKIVDIL